MRRYSHLPLLIDLGCKAGGASAGYVRKGWDVIGVDIEPQPHYPYQFIQADFIAFLERLIAGGTWEWIGLGIVDAFHASPPCLKFTAFQMSQPQRENRHVDLITPIRPLLEATGRPYVIENVPGAPLIDPVTVCGTAFGLGVPRGQLWRHRWFEGAGLVGTTCQHDGRPCVMVAGHGTDGYRGSGLNAAEARAAMRIDWMNRNELAQAVPPDYTAFIAPQLRAQTAGRRMSAHKAGSGKPALSPAEEEANG